MGKIKKKKNRVPTPNGVETKKKVHLGGGGPTGRRKDQSFLLLTDAG